MSSSHYDLLEVDFNATDDEIRKAYKIKAKQLHPDVNKASDAQQQFQLLHEAYETLIDPNKRHIYDLQGTGKPLWDKVDNYMRGTRPFHFMPEYDEWVRLKKERAKQMMEAEMEAFQNKKKKLQNSHFYIFYQCIFYLKTTLGYSFGIAALGICAYCTFITHPIILCLLLPFICGAVFLIKWTNEFYKDEVRYFK